jgi:hypothetical protein
MALPSAYRSVIIERSLYTVVVAGGAARGCARMEEKMASEQVKSRGGEGSAVPGQAKAGLE